MDGLSLDEQCAVAAAVHHRRRLAVILWHLQHRRRRNAKRKQQHFFSWAEYESMLDERDFQRCFRLTRAGFQELHDALRNQLEVDSVAQAVRSRGYPIDSRVRLAVTLRYLAGGSYIDLRQLYKISKTEVFHCVWKTVDAINGYLKIVFPLDDPDKLAILEAEFAAHSRKQVWRGQVACVDGADFKQKNPGVAVPNPLEHYVGRKGCYAILCIATCDYARRFLSYDMNMGARTHDSLAWKNSKVGGAVLRGELGPNYFVNGDAAFGMVPGMMVPATGPGTDDFNFEQSSNRMPIECAFGILVMRWGILWRPLCMRYDRRTNVIECCMKLHNFCIDRRIEIDLKSNSGWTEIAPGRWDRTPLFDRDGRPVEFKSGGDVGDVRGAVGDDRMRQDLIRKIKDAGLRRPSRHARRTSRHERR